MLHSPLTDRPIVIIILLRIDETFTRCAISIWILEMIHLTFEIREDISGYHTRCRPWLIEGFFDDVGEEMRKSFIVGDEFLSRDIPVSNSHFEFSCFAIYLRFWLSEESYL